MTSITSTVQLTERAPQMSGTDMVASLVPPPQFDGAPFDSYRADAAYPSQQEGEDPHRAAVSSVARRRRQR